MAAFTVRSPTLEEIPTWGHFVATRGFAHRPGPVDRFTQRFVCDPSARPSHIVAAYGARAEGGAEEVVGCVRLFFRTLALCGDGSASAAVVGWGEVCSDPDLRGRGIVGLVLREAVARMERGEAREGAALPPPPPASFALLHAAPAVLSLYEKYGFVAGTLPILYGRVAVGRAGAALPAPPAPLAPLLGHPLARVRPVDFDADWAALEALRARQAARLGLAGWTLRSEAYWRQWVRNACRGQALVLELQAAAPGEGRAPAPHAPAAYGYVRWREGAWRLMDWAAAGSEGSGGEGSSGSASPALLTDFMGVLLAAGHAFHAAAGDAGVPSPLEPALLLPGERLVVAAPLAVVRDVCGGEGAGEEVEALRDIGWMAKAPLAGAGAEAGAGGPGAPSASSGASGSPLHTLQAAAARGKFVIFNADNI